LRRVTGFDFGGDLRMAAAFALASPAAAALRP
jgi:hypothetical protein